MQQLCGKKTEPACKEEEGAEDVRSEHNWLKIGAKGFGSESELKKERSEPIHEGDSKGKW